MFRQLSKKKNTAAATIEYVALITFLLAVFFVFQTYIGRGMLGRWRTVGESAGFGLRFHPKNTVQCEYDFVYTNRWYNLLCYEERCDCETLRQSAMTCRACILGCTIPGCDA